MLSVPRLFSGKVARDTLLVMSWQMVRIFGQAIWMILLARLLEPSRYGIFAGISGLAVAVSSFSGLGLGLVMYQEVVRFPDKFHDHWSKSIVVTVLSGLFLVPAFLVLQSFVLPTTVDIYMVLLIALAEILFFPVITTSAYAFAAHACMGWAAALPAFASLARVGAVLLFSLSSAPAALDRYVLFHAAGLAGVSVTVFLLVLYRLRPCFRYVRITLKELKAGFGFLSTWVTGNALTTLDKSLVLKWAGSEVTGIYATAYRFAAVVAIPVDSLVMAAMPRLFRFDSNSARSFRLLGSLVLATLGYSFLGGVALWWGAAFLPVLLGHSYQAVVDAVRWMAFFLPFYSLRILGENLLLAVQNKTMRVLAEGAGLILMMAIGFILMPYYGLFGAVATIIAVEAILALTIWFFVAQYMRSV